MGENGNWADMGDSDMECDFGHESIKITVLHIKSALSYHDSPCQ